MKQSRVSKSKQTSQNQAATSSNILSRQGTQHGNKGEKSATGVSSISGGNSMQGNNQQAGTSKQNKNRLQSSQNQRTSKEQKAIQRQDSQIKKQKDQQDASALMGGINGNKIRQNMHNQKEFQLRKTKNLDQLNKAGQNRQDKDQHCAKDKNAGSGQPKSNHPSIEVNKTGNTVYINGLSGGSNVIKKQSIDMSAKEQFDGQPNGLPLRSKTFAANQEGILKGGDGQNPAQVSRAQKLKSQHNQMSSLPIGTQSIGNEQQLIQLQQSRIEEQLQLMQNYQPHSLNVTNQIAEGLIQPGTAENSMLSQTADKRQSLRTHQMGIPPPQAQIASLNLINTSSSQLGQHFNQANGGAAVVQPMQQQNTVVIPNNRQRPKSSVPSHKQVTGNPGNGHCHGAHQQNAIIQHQMQVIQGLQMGNQVPGQSVNTSANSMVSGARKTTMSNGMPGPPVNSSQQQPYIISKQMNLLSAEARQNYHVASQNTSELHNTQPVLQAGHPATNPISQMSQTPQILMNKQNLMVQTHNQLANQPPGSLLIPGQNQSQTAFFEKRNRSRGLQQQQLISNPNMGPPIPPNMLNMVAVQSTPHTDVRQSLAGQIGPPQQIALQSQNTFGSPNSNMPESSSSKKGANQSSIMQSIQMQTMNSEGFPTNTSQDMTSQLSQHNAQRQLMKDFQAQQILRQTQQQQMIEPVTPVLQLGMSMSTHNQTPGGMRLSGNTSMAPNSALPKMIQNGQQHFNVDQPNISNTDTKQRHTVQYTGGENSQLIPMKSFDKRPPHPQSVINDANVPPLSQDMKNKENMTQKPLMKKGTIYLPPGSSNPGESTNFNSSQKARILQLSNQGYEHAQTVAKNSQRSEMGLKQSMNGSTPQQSSIAHLRESNQGNKMVEIQSQKTVPNKSVQIQQENIEMQLVPQTDKFFKKTYRHFFKRRPNKLEHPVIIIQFQGILGDFFKDGGVSTKQDHIMSKQYLQQLQNQQTSHGPLAPGNSDQQSSNMWVRIGTIDGLRYLSKHFQIVIFNRDSYYEELEQQHQQIQMIHSYFQLNDIMVDGIYGESQIQMQIDSEGGLGSSPNQQAVAAAAAAAAKNKKDKSKGTDQKPNQLKKPYKQGEIWEDYRQIYLDFGMTSDKKIRDKVLFVNSFDSDYNARQEEIRYDSKGYFLLDIQSKPARPLVAGLPLSYETKEKEIDLSDKGQMFQFKLAKNRDQTKEMPVTILVPNPRTVYCQQLSFASIAKTIMTMCFVGQNLNLQMSKKLSPQEIEYLQFYLKNLRYLQEFDVKVQKDQCLLQYNPSQQRLQANIFSQYSTQQQQMQNATGAAGDESIDPENSKAQMYRSTNSQNDRGTSNNNQNVKTKPPSKFGNRNNSNQSIDSMYNRPRSSNSHGRILQANGPQMQPLYQEEEQQMNIDIEFFQNNETMVIPLTEQLFQNLSWAQSFDFINESGSGQKEILGLIPVRSNVIWRYFLSLLKQRSNIRQLREKRIAEIKTLLQKLDQLQTEQGKLKRQQQIQDIYDTLKQVQTSGNPLTNMMARNLKVFIKIYAEVKRKSKRELENFTEALVMDQKMAELEKQNLENRIFLLGAKKPNQFFNTHPRAYEKVPVSIIEQMNKNIQVYQQQQNKLQENQGNNMNLMNGPVGGSQTHALQKQKTTIVQNSNFAYSSISSNDQVNSDPSHRSLMEIAQNSNSKSKGARSSNKNANNATPGTQAAQQNYGKKKQSSGVQSACNNQSLGNVPQSAIQNFSTQSSAAHYSRRRVASRGANEPNSATDGNNSKRSNQSSEFQLPPPSAPNIPRGTNQSTVS